MTCADLTDMIEPWAAGEFEPPAEAAAHVAGCRSCAAQLALAREIEAALAAPHVAPPQFTANVLRAVRQEAREIVSAPSRWGTWLGMVLAALAAGIVMLLVPIVDEPIVDVWLPVAAALTPVLGALTAAPPVVYVGPTGLIVMTLMLWQWVEGDA